MTPLGEGQLRESGWFAAELKSPAALDGKGGEQYDSTELVTDPGRRSGSVRLHNAITAPAVTPEETPVVRAEMLIRRPAEEVYGAFVDPSITTRFWFTDSSGPLEPDAKVVWRWAMYGASTEAHVLDLRPSERILIEWDDPATQVEWVFTGRPDGTTLVSITNSGFVGAARDVVRQALDSMGGFSFVLAGAKAFLEFGIELNLVADHYPDAHV